MRRLMMRLNRHGGVSCARVHELVQSYLDDELDGPERDRLRAHLHLCKRCGVEARIYDEIKVSLATRPPPDSITRLRSFARSLTESLKDG